jgi:hypothetical protein
MRRERGSAPLWFLGLSVCILMVGAMSAELWRAMGERHELVAMADAAAIAGAAVVDLVHYRATGQVRIDEEQAVSRALAVIDGHSGGQDLSSVPLIEIAADGSSVRIELTREVSFGLLRILSMEDDRFIVTGRAVAYPHSP